MTPSTADVVLLDAVFGEDAFDFGLPLIEVDEIGVLPTRLDLLRIGMDGWCVLPCASFAQSAPGGSARYESWIFRQPRSADRSITGR